MLPITVEILHLFSPSLFRNSYKRRRERAISSFILKIDPFSSSPPPLFDYRMSSIFG